jgi:hypothetical protein
MRKKPAFSVRAHSQQALAILFTAALCGCATELDNPEAYVNPFGGNGGASGSANGGTSGGGTANGGGGSGGAPATCDAPTLVFQVDGMQGGCNGAACHVQGGAFPPDLVSADVADRLVDVPSEGQFCSGQLLIDSQNIENSLILKKLVADPECGDQMPFGLDPLSDEKAQCIRTWIQSVVAQ